MRITLSEYAGFCEGVDRAYEIIRKAAKNSRVAKPIYVLGSLVHNQDVVKKIEELGVKKLHVEKDLFQLLDGMKGKIGTLVITAHGMGPKIYEYARQKNINLIDTTCPRVIKAQRLAQVFFNRLYQIVIVGDRDHKETKGINEWAREEAVFVENNKDLKNLKLDARKKIAVLSQTTQDEEFVHKVAKFIRKKYPMAKVAETICNTTHNRQQEVKNLARENDAVIIIGSPDSANSTRLWDIAKRLNCNSYFVEQAPQIKKEWIANCKKVGVTAGASTPKWVIKEVVGCLRKI